MNFKDMRYLKKIAECGNYSLAAKELFLSQPALTHTVKMVEQEYGVSLFRKAGKKTVPTEEGILLLQSSERILNILEQMEEHFNRVSLQSSPVLLMLSTQIIPTHYAVAALPQEAIRLEQIVSHQDWMDTFSWDLHLSVVKRKPESAEIAVLRRVGLCCAMDKAHPLADKTEISLTDLKKIPLLLPVPNSAVRSDIEEIFSEHGFLSQIAMESDNYSSYEDFLFGRDWIAIAPDYTAGLQYSSNLVLRPWTEFGEERRQYLCLRHNKRKPLSPHASVVQEHLLHFCSV